MENQVFSRYIKVIFGDFSRRFDPDACPVHTWSFEKKCAPGMVYIARSGDLYKIGFTSSLNVARSLEVRMSDISRRLRITFRFEHGLYANCGRGLERHLHKQFSRMRFDVAYQAGIHSNANEIFRLGSEDLVWLLTVRQFNHGEVIHFGSIAAVQDAVAAGRLRRNEYQASGEG